MKNYKKKLPRKKIKKIPIINGILLLFFLLTAVSPLSAWDKKTSIEVIHKAKTMINEFDDNQQISPYIPFKEYSDAFINLIIAQNELNKENYKLAYYYARMTIVQLETITILAKAKDYSNKIIQAERDYYKAKTEKGTTTSKETSLGAIVLIEAHLFKKADTYNREYLDKELFVRSSFSISANGKTELDKIVDVLKLFPESKIIIIGHSSYTDYKNYSRYKASVVTKYLRDRGIPLQRISFNGMGNSEVMDTAVGYRRINRIEIIITDIKL